MLVSLLISVQVRPIQKLFGTKNFLNDPHVYERVSEKFCHILIRVYLQSVRQVTEAVQAMVGNRWGL